LNDCEGLEIVTLGLVEGLIAVQPRQNENPSTRTAGARDAACVHPASDHRIEFVTADCEQEMTGAVLI
jgi:hypothetical protein